MLAWVVIDRTYPRQFLPKSSSPRTLCLCVEFSDSFRPTSVVPTTYALPLATAAPQPLCNQSVTHSFYLDGGWIPPSGAALTTAISRMPIPCSLSPLFSIPCALFCTFLHSPKNSTLFFSSDSALFAKNTRGGGRGALLPETATPFPQRWGLLRKGRAVFRREDRVDCFVVNKNYVRAISCQVVAAGLPARSASFRAHPARLVSPCSPTARRRAKRPVPAAEYSSACRSYRQSVDRCACSSPRSANHWSTNARIRW